ncbi:MAG: Membrane fusogenic [Pseudomonadota bacterium]|jgi:BMFP domain-containing protein YqiC
MINKQFFEDLTQQLTRLLPQAEAAGEEARKAMAAMLQKAFASLDLLTREEFAAQSAALARAEERLAHLEQEMTRLEALVKEQGKA